MILHIPHSSTALPESMGKDLLVTYSQLQQEIVLMSDYYCDNLFQYPETRRIVFPWSRLFCDVERFESDAEEPASAYGHGMYYLKTFAGNPLRKDTFQGRQEAILVYRKHHQEFTRIVDEEISSIGISIIVDCHSFSKNVVRNGNNEKPYPDICIGSDAFHTPPEFANSLIREVQKLGYSATINYPFSGSIVPMKYYNVDKRVISVMIEINRSLYLNENSDEKSGQYERTKELCTALLANIHAYFYKVGR